MNSNNNNQQVDQKRLNERARCRRYYHEHKEHIAETQRRYYKRNALKFAILGRQKRERKSLALKGTIPAKRTSKYDIYSKIEADPSVANTLHIGVQNQPSVQSVTYVTNGFDNCVQPSVQPFTNVVNYVQPAMNLVNCVQPGVQPVTYVTNGFNNYVQPAMNLVNCVQPGVQQNNGETNML